MKMSIFATFCNCLNDGTGRWSWRRYGKDQERDDSWILFVKRCEENRERERWGEVLLPLPPPPPPRPPCCPPGPCFLLLRCVRALHLPTSDLQLSFIDCQETLLLHHHLHHLSSSSAAAALSATSLLTLECFLPLNKPAFLPHTLSRQPPAACLNAQSGQR
jgi:hypothetical protein